MKGNNIPRLTKAGGRIKAVCPRPRHWPSMPLEELDLPLVLFCGLAAAECSQVPPLAGRRIQLAGVKPVLAGFELSDHRRPPVFFRFLAPAPCLLAPESWPLAPDFAFRSWSIRLAFSSS